MSSTLYNRWFYWLLGATALVLFFRIGAAPVYILDEAKNAQCAREMLHNSDWIVPTFNGQLRTDKPVLHYWFMICSYKMFGETAAAARLFSAVLGVATIAIVFWFVKKWKHAGVAFCCTLVLALSTHFLFEFRLSVPDPYLIFFNTAGLVFAFCYLQEKKWLWIVLTAISLALATLAKGPVALALPGLSLFIFLIISKRWKEILDVKLLVALAVYLAVAVPWYWQVHVATHGEWTRGFFLEHNLDRFSGEMEGHGGWFIVTPIIVLVGLLPFSITFFSVFRKRYIEGRSALMTFSVVVTLVYVVFFSISSTKLPNYPMPCYPFAAILLGRFLFWLIDKRQALPMYAKISLIIISLGLSIGGYFAIRAEPGASEYAWLSIPLLVLPCILIFAFFRKKYQYSRRWLTWMIVGYFLFNFYFLGIAYPLLYQQNPVSKTLPLIDQSPHVLGAYKAYNPAFNFNDRSSTFYIPVFSNPASIDSFCVANQSPGTPAYVITRLAFLHELDSTRFVKMAQERDLFELPTTVILQWKANFKN